MITHKIRSALARACAGVLALASVPLSQAATSPSPAAVRIPGADMVRAETLPNGMRIIVWTDKDIPNVALYNWVRAGSRNEAPGITGLAHFFEHMMFNGTARRPPGAFDREMEASGGANNAFTSDDVTVYQDWFPRSALELIFDLESDRIANLAFDPKSVESERGVVYSERRQRVEDDNAGLLVENVQATAFAAHPYQFPTIGWPSDIRSWRMEDLQTFFRTYYAPNNCTLVFVGDVSPEEIFALARRYFGPIPRQAEPPAVRTVEPKQLGEKRVNVERRGQTPLLHYAYKAPAGTDSRAAAISILVTALAEGDASRLHRLLVEQKQLAIGIDAYWSEGFDPGLLWLQATLPSGGDAATLERTLDDELARVVREGFTQAELDRARNLLTVAFWRQFATINGKARLLGEYEVMHGDYRKLFDVPTAIANVSLADVKAVAAEILDPRVRTVGVLKPLAAADAQPQGDDGDDDGDDDDGSTEQPPAKGAL